MRAEIYWVIKEPVWLGVLPRPRGDDYIEDEIGSLRDQGMDVLVSLLTAEESEELGLGAEEEACKKNSVRFISFPIEDRSVPRDSDAVARLVQAVRESLDQDKRVGIHCRAGIGRSAMIAAAVLVGLGFSPDAAFKKISDARGCDVPDTSAQRSWIEQFGRSGER